MPNELIAIIRDGEKLHLRPHFPSDEAPENTDDKSHLTTSNGKNKTPDNNSNSLPQSNNETHSPSHSADHEQTSRRAAESDPLEGNTRVATEPPSLGIQQRSVEKSKRTLSVDGKKRRNARNRRREKRRRQEAKNARSNLPQQRAIPRPSEDPGPTPDPNSCPIGATISGTPDGNENMVDSIPAPSEVQPSRATSLFPSPFGVDNALRNNNAESTAIITENTLPQNVTGRSPLLPPPEINVRNVELQEPPQVSGNDPSLEQQGDPPVPLNSPRAPTELAYVTANGKRRRIMPEAVDSIPRNEEPVLTSNLEQCAPEGLGKEPEITPTRTSPSSRQDTGISSPTLQNVTEKLPSNRLRKLSSATEANHQNRVNYKPPPRENANSPSPPRDDALAPEAPIGVGGKQDMQGSPGSPLQVASSPALQAPVRSVVAISDGTSGKQNGEASTDPQDDATVPNVATVLESLRPNTLSEMKEKNRQQPAGQSLNRVSISPSQISEEPRREELPSHSTKKKSRGRKSSKPRRLLPFVEPDNSLGSSFINHEEGVISNIPTAIAPPEDSALYQKRNNLENRPAISTLVDPVAGLEKEPGHTKAAVDRKVSKRTKHMSVSNVLDRARSKGLLDLANNNEVIDVDKPNPQRGNQELLAHDQTQQTQRNSKRNNGKKGTAKKRKRKSKAARKYLEEKQHNESFFLGQDDTRELALPPLELLEMPAGQPNCSALDDLATANPSRSNERADPKNQRSSRLSTLKMASSTEQTDVALPSRSAHHGPREGSQSDFVGASGTPISRQTMAAQGRSIDEASAGSEQPLARSDHSQAENYRDSEHGTAHGAEHHDVVDKEPRDEQADSINVEGIDKRDEDNQTSTSQMQRNKISLLGRVPLTNPRNVTKQAANPAKKTSLLSNKEPDTTLGGGGSERNFLAQKKKSSQHSSRLTPASTVARRRKELRRVSSSPKFVSADPGSGIQTHDLPLHSEDRDANHEDTSNTGEQKAADRGNADACPEVNPRKDTVDRPENGSSQNRAKQHLLVQAPGSMALTSRFNFPRPARGSAVDFGNNYSNDVMSAMMDATEALARISGGWCQPPETNESKVRKK